MAKRRGLYKVGEIYYISYAHHGKTVRKSTKQNNFRVAQDMLNAVRTAIVRGEYDLDRKPTPLFEKYADYFLEYHSKPNKRSWERDVTVIRNLKRAFSGKLLSGITKEDIRHYKVDRRKQTTNTGKPVAKSTIDRELACLKTIFNHAMEEEKGGIKLAACAFQRFTIQFISG